MKANELRKKRAAIVEQMRGLLDKADTEKRELSDDELRQHGELEAEQKRLAEKITEREKLDERQAALDKELREIPAEHRAERPGEEDRGGGGGDEKRFESFGDFLLAVRRAGSPGHVVDQRLSTRSATGMSESVPSDGGFVVQKDHSTDLLKRIFQGGQILSRVRKIPISSNSNGLKINALKDNSRANGSRWGGIRAYWTDEAAQKTPSRPEFRQIGLDLKKLTGLCYATDELLDDAAALESVITQGFNDEFTFVVEDSVMNGSGAGQPLGFMNSGALIKVAIEATQTIANSATFLAANSAKMMARMPARNFANAVWLVNQMLMPYMIQMTIGGSGGATPVYLPGGNLSGSPFGTLLGRPVVPVEYAAALGTPGDFSLVDLSEYLMIDKGSVKSDVSIHVRFIYDETTFRFVYRVDGQPVWNAVLTPYKGSDTQSPYVALDTRS